MHSEIVSLKEQLAIAYVRNKKPVAFIDESYQSVHEGLPFYLVSAVMIEPRMLDAARETCLEIAEDYWWHTTDAFQSRKLDRIYEFLSYLALTEINNVVAIQSLIHNNNLEHARRECLIQAVKAAEDFGTGLVVLERRQSQKSQRSDTSLFAKASQDDQIGKHLRFFQVSPSVEQLLWLPDVLSWSIRRLLALGEQSWVEITRNNLGLINVSGEFLDLNSFCGELPPINAKRPQRAVAKGCGPAKPVGSSNEGISRSSGSIMPQQSESLQHFPQSFGQLITPPIDPVVLSTWLKSRFPK